MVTLTKHVISGPNLHSAGPLALKGFLQNRSEDQKKSLYYLSVEPWHCAIWQIRRWLLDYVHKKFR